MDRRATSAGLRPRARRIAGACLVVAGCGEPAGVAAPQGPAEPARGTMVPAATREVRLPAATLAAEPAAPAAPEAAPAASGDPRAVPAGTPAHVARVFQRLPVAIHDGPPLGGIGESGIHVDKIWLGSDYEKDGCAGEAAEFSLGRHSQVNVCFRVVHSRQDEDIHVEWVKDEVPLRRRAVHIPDLHAYRSRAYLVLRREYLGRWQARVLSSDAVELARASFTVTE